MKEVIPIFPLQIVSFPGERVSLHIFEPRYKQLIEHCEKDGITFGLTPVLDGKLAEYGTELVLKEIVNRYPDGRFDVRCEGKGCYKQTAYFRSMEDRLYPGGEIERIPLDLSGEESLSVLIVSHIARMFELMKIEKPLPDVHAEGLTFKIGHQVGLTRQQECHLLSIEKETERQKYMLEHLESFIPSVIEQEEMRRKIQLNGHFRHLKPGL